MFKILIEHKKKVITIILLFIIFASFYNNNIKTLLRPTYHKIVIVYNNFIPEKFKALNKILFNKVDYRSVLNDYNTSFLPNTFEIKKNYKSIKLDFLKSNNIFSVEAYANKYRPSGINYALIDLIDDENIIFTSKNAEFYTANLKKINDKKKLTSKDVKRVNSNLKSIKVLDSLIHETNFYVSHVIWNEKKNCSNFKVSVSPIDIFQEKLSFTDFFLSEECAKQAYAGRMQYIKFHGYNGILITTSDTMGNQPTNNSQNKNSIFGKTLYLEKNNEYEIYSYGHRNAQGLYVNNSKQIVLSTEHGPKGGDEINLIEKGKNYGWPISSYGNKYNQPKIDLEFNDNHIDYGFQEPIYAFVPSIGISELISIPNSFNDLWKNNYFVSSLWGESLYRIRLSKNYDKIIYNEKIYIGKRIRDLKHSKLKNNFLLSLEDYWRGSAYLGILSN